MFLSIVVPCFNEEEVIELTLNRLEQLLIRWVEKDIINSFELILVDDGSHDKTQQILRERAIATPNIKIIRFSRNFGHQAALHAGYAYASGDAVATLDADLQHPPNLIEVMLKKLQEGFEIVYAARKNRKSVSFFKRTSARLFYRLMTLLGAETIPDHADFRLVTRKVVRELLRFRETNLFLRSTFPAIGFTSCIVYYNQEARAAGKTKYTLKKMIELAFDGITSFSVVPLRICSLIGFVVSLVSAGLLVWTLVVKIMGGAVQGWASTVVPLYFLGGVQLMFLGVVGEYIGKIYMETKARPRYIVEKTYNLKHEEQYHNSK